MRELLLKHFRAPGVSRMALGSWSASLETFAIHIDFAAGLLTRSPQPVVLECMTGTGYSTGPGQSWWPYVVAIAVIFFTGAYVGHRFTLRTAAAIAP